jgi:hypothetical protein
VELEFGNLKHLTPFAMTSRSPSLSVWGWCFLVWRCSLASLFGWELGFCCSYLSRGLRLLTTETWWIAGSCEKESEWIYWHRYQKNHARPVCAGSAGQLFFLKCLSHKKSFRSFRCPFDFFVELGGKLGEHASMHTPYFVCAHKFFESDEYFLNILKWYECYQDKDFATYRISE